MKKSVLNTYMYIVRVFTYILVRKQCSGNKDSRRLASFSFHLVDPGTVNINGTGDQHQVFSSQHLLYQRTEQVSEYIVIPLTSET